MSAYYYKGVKTNRIYQYWVGPGGLTSLPNGFVDQWGNLQTEVPAYHSPDGVVEDIIMCLPYGGVQYGTAGPPPADNPYAPGHIFSAWEQNTS